MEGREPCRKELKDGREKGKDGQGLTYSYCPGHMNYLLLIGKFLTIAMIK